MVVFIGNQALYHHHSQLSSDRNGGPLNTIASAAAFTFAVQINRTNTLHKVHTIAGLHYASSFEFGFEKKAVGAIDIIVLLAQATKIR